MAKAKKKVYGIADKAWQPIVGCDPHMACAPRCWARRTVARIVKCQEPVSPERAAFFQIALTPDGQKWSGEVFLDEAHLLDPMKWRKPAVIATGFHGDWGRLAADDKHQMFSLIALCAMFRNTYPHDFWLLTKQPQDVLEYLSDAPEDLSMSWGAFAGDMLGIAGKQHHERIDAFISAAHGFYPDDENMLEEDAFHIPLPNVSIGCSVMNQSEADKMLPAMRRISDLGWRTHVWYEPAIGPVKWDGWGFIELLIPGGESGSGARPFDIAWARNAIAWGAANKVAVWMKQLGAKPEETVTSPIDGYQWQRALVLKDRKGGEMPEWPVDLRVRQMPEVSNVL